jgi:hypothetical protein
MSFLVQNYTCKHVIGISFRENLFTEYPEKGVVVGRPKKMSKALVIDN